MDCLLEGGQDRFYRFFGLLLSFAIRGHSGKDLLSDSEFGSDVLICLNFSLNFLFPLLLINCGKFLQMLLLPVIDCLHLLADRGALRIPDRVHQLAQHHGVSFRAHAVAMGVLDPILDKFDIALDLLLEYQCNLVGILSHNFLQLLGAHQLRGPLHLVLPELQWEFFLLKVCNHWWSVINRIGKWLDIDVTYLFLFFVESVHDMEVGRFNQLLVNLFFVGRFVFVE